MSYVAVVLIVALSAFLALAHWRIRALQRWDAHTSELMKRTHEAMLTAVMDSESRRSESEKQRSEAVETIKAMQERIDFLTNIVEVAAALAAPAHEPQTFFSTEPEREATETHPTEDPDMVRIIGTPQPGDESTAAEKTHATKVQLGFQSSEHDNVKRTLEYLRKSRPSRQGGGVKIPASFDAPLIDQGGGEVEVRGISLLGS